MKHRGFAFVRVMVGAAIVVLATIGGVATHQVMESRDQAARYREELARLESDYVALQQDFAGLRDQYNDAVRRSAVTELLVEDGRLDVLIRTSEGVLKRIETSFDPQTEIYVDYAILDGRLWIRRLFDSYTPPESGLVIDPLVETIDWDQRPEGFGKAVYRSLRPGRWVITMTGNGSLGLARVSSDADVELTTQPPVKPFEPVTAPEEPRRPKPR